MHEILLILDTSTAFHTKCIVLAKCNSQRISIQWFHIKHYSGYQYTKIQPYQTRVHFFCHFARYAISVPQLLAIHNKRSITCNIHVHIFFSAVLIKNKKKGTIRSVFLYSGSISSIIQAISIQKFNRIKLGCNFFVILQDTRFRFPKY